MDRLSSYGPRTTGPRLVALTTLVIMTLSAQAQGNADPQDKYLGRNPLLSRVESQALSGVKTWREGTLSDGVATRYVMAPDGVLRFPWTIGEISVVCAPLMPCDLELEPGEVMTGKNIGDGVRWKIDAAVSKDPNSGQEIQHLVIKPSDVPLETNLFIYTDRRTYSVRLKSHRTQYMPRVGFMYPEVEQQQYVRSKQLQAQARAQAQSAEAKLKAERTLPSGELLDKLDFAYRIEGESAFKPVRVYNNGKKTIIQMPEAISREETPTLLALTRKGGIFSDEETKMVNYSVQGDRYVVDNVPERVILIAGVGSAQSRVTITRGR